MKLLVSLHDVAPPFARPLESLWRACADHGVRPALFVVPNWHGEHPLDDAPDFAAWIRARAADGAEVLLHGLRHDEVGSRRGWRDRWRAMGRTAREGEFLALDFAAASVRLHRGRAALERAGLSPLGFVPPAWLGRPSLRRAARVAGFAVTEDVAHVHDLQARRRIPSPVLRWSTRASWRVHASVVLSHARWTAQRTDPLVRIALHPLDWSSAVVQRDVLRSLARWRADRVPIGYRELLAQPADGAVA